MLLNNKQPNLSNYPSKISNRDRHRKKGSSRSRFKMCSSEKYSKMSNRYNRSSEI